MLNVVPYGFYYGGRVEVDTPERGDLASAHASAAGLLAGSGRDERAFWTRQTWSFLLGAVTPLIGHVSFGRPVGLVVFAISLDVVALWLADLVRALFASDTFQLLARRQLATENALLMARAMLAHRRRPTRGIPARRVVENRHPWLAFLALYVGCYGVMAIMYAAILLEAVVLDPDSGIDRASLWWLAVPALLRIGTALRDVTTVQDGRVDVQLQPQALLPLGALMWSSLFSAWVLSLLDDEQRLRSMLEPYFGVLFLVVYLVCAVGLSLLAMRRLHAAEADLRRFTAIDLAQWQDRLSGTTSSARA